MSIDARLVKTLPAGADSQSFELDIHLVAESGISVLFGPSGAGKTLTLNCLAGFARPDEGRILVNDQLFFDAAANVHLSPQRRRCGYIFQDHALFPHMTVRQNLHFAASAAPSEKNRGLNRRRRINELIDSFELGDFAARTPAQLSGGQKQRAALARILVSEPRLLLLDEPTRGLDARLRQSFYDVLRKTRQRLNVPTVLVTHDLEECFELADTVFLIDRGHILQSGPKEFVLSKPATLDVARSLGVYNIVPAGIAALDPSRNTSRLTVLNQEIDAPYLPSRLIGDQGFLCIRQAEIAVLPSGSRAAHNQLLLRVVSTARCARGIRILFEHDVAATVSETQFQELRGNDRLALEIPASAVYFIGK